MSFSLSASRNPHTRATPGYQNGAGAGGQRGTQMANFSVEHGAMVGIQTLSRSFVRQDSKPRFLHFFTSVQYKGVVSGLKMRWVVGLRTICCGHLEGNRLYPTTTHYSGSLVRCILVKRCPCAGRKAIIVVFMKY